MNEPRDRTTGNEFLAEMLAHYGLSHVFGVPTVAVNAFPHFERRGIIAITAHSEKAAAYMADGYSRASRGPSVCLAQAIGSTNIAAGLRDAYMGYSPVVAMTGGTHPKSHNRNHYQEVDDFPAFEPLTKFNVKVDHVQRLPDLLRQAFRSAVTGCPGPVHLELQGLSANVLDKTLRPDTVSAETRYAGFPPWRPRAAIEDLNAAVAALDAATRPVIVAGGGVRMSDGAAELLKVADCFHIPVATSFSAKGVMDESHPLAVGVVGSYSRDSANQAVAEADLVFFVGCQGGSQVTDNWRLPTAGRAKIIQLDINPEELGRIYPNDVSLLGDAKSILSQLLAFGHAATRRPRTDRTDWLTRCAEFVTDWRRRVAELTASNTVPNKPIRPERLVGALDALLPANAVIAVDTGHAAIWVAALMDLRPSHTFIRCAGSLGWAFPAALGAKCALPERPTVCFTGDGGFYYHLAELETARRYGINVVVVVNNNRSLSQDYEVFDAAYAGEQTAQGRKLWEFEDVDLAEIARGMGVQAERVVDPGRLSSALAEAFSADGPVVLDVATDWRAIPPPPYGGRAFYAS